MSRCQAKKGFFTLRDCSGTAAGDCRQCGRHICSDHLSAEDPQVCKECMGKMRDREYDDDEWFYSYRHVYYTEHHYNPIYFGHHYRYYDDYDVRSFDSRDDHDDGVLDDDAGDFNDS